MWAIASTVTIGLTPEAVGNVEASQTTTGRGQIGYARPRYQRTCHSPRRIAQVWLDRKSRRSAGVKYRISGP
jgi:hypothetical protein